MFDQGEWVDLQLNQGADRVEGVTEYEAGAIKCAEQVSQQRERAVRGAGEKQCRSPLLIYPPLHGPDLQMRVKRGLDPDKHPGSLKIGDTFPQIAISHSNTFLAQL